jgi:phosphoesterase RecJ-like protein
VPLIERYAPETISRAREVFSALVRARRVLVTSEPYPDGDALGAELALDAIARHAFARAGGGDRRVYLVNEKGCPRKYRFIAGADKVRRLDSLIERDFDVAIVVDGGSERIGAAKEIFDRAPFKIYIDHHKFGSRERYDLSLSVPDATSTTQILYAFFADPEIAVPLDASAAEGIYLGLIFDTGSFQYSLTQPLSHEIAAHLMDTGIDFAKIHEKALLTQEYEDLIAQGRVIATASRTPSREIVWASIGLELIEDCRVSGDDFNRIIQTLCFVEGAEVALLFRELERGKWKLSFRSRGKVDVAAVARELDPQGGGHDRAAGCTIEGPLESVIERTVRLVESKLAAGAATR